MTKKLSKKPNFQKWTENRCRGLYLNPNRVNGANRHRLMILHRLPPHLTIGGTTTSAIKWLKLLRNYRWTFWGRVINVH